MIKLRVTNTQIEYEGSITIGRKLLNGLLDGEVVQVTPVTGIPFETYVIAGDKGLRKGLNKLLVACHIGTYNLGSVSGRREVITQILDLCEEGVCVNGAAARLVQVGDIIEVTNKETE